MNELAQKLQAPFPPEAVDFRPQGQPNDKGEGRVVAYVDARAVQDRLDEVFGPLGWSFTWEPLIQTATAITAVRGTISVDGVAKSDIGDAGDTEPSKSAVSDAFKRAAVQWGVGRYLYDLGASYVKTRQAGKSWVPADGEVARLRSKLHRPASQGTQADPLTAAKLELEKQRVRLHMNADEWAALGKAKNGGRTLDQLDIDGLRSFYAWVVKRDVEGVKTFLTSPDAWSALDEI